MHIQAHPRVALFEIHVRLPEEGYRHSGECSRKKTWAGCGAFAHQLLRDPRGGRKVSGSGSARAHNGGRLSNGGRGDDCRDAVRT